MSMLIVWNVSQDHRGASDRLRQAAYDVALLSEAPPWPDIPGVNPGRTEGLDGGRRPWSAAVLSPHPAIEVTNATPTWRSRGTTRALKASRLGSWVAADVDLPDLGPVTAVSLYGLMDEFSDASMHRSLSDIAPLVDDPHHRDRLIIGGDFNTGTQWPAHELMWNRRDHNVLDRLAAWGLVDVVDRFRAHGQLDGCRCQDGDGCRHVRTRLDARWPDIPYQTDYLFMAPALAERVRDCEVRANDEWFACSDHAPIVAVLE